MGMDWMVRSCLGFDVGILVKKIMLPLLKKTQNLLFPFQFYHNTYNNNNNKLFG